MHLKGNILTYRRAIIKLYGLGYDEELEQRARRIVQYKQFRLEELEQEYKFKLQQLIDNYSQEVNNGRSKA